MNHVDDETCPCNPTVYFSSGECNVLVHYGENGEVPSASMLVSAIRLCIQDDLDGKHGNVSIEPEPPKEEI